MFLNIGGIWKEIVVDDYFPVRRSTGKPMTVMGAPVPDLWAMIAEKAYAKAYGSYINIAGNGSPINALTDFTGSRPDIHPHISIDAYDAQELLECMTEHIDKNLVTCAKREVGANQIEREVMTTVLFVGQVKNRAGKSIPVVKVRNNPS